MKIRKSRTLKKIEVHFFFFEKADTKKINGFAEKNRKFQYFYSKKFLSPPCLFLPHRLEY